MPPALHPRSRMTSSLFVSTLIISFLVVGAPHVLPCPAPRAFADSEVDIVTDPTGRRRRRRRRIVDEEGKPVPMEHANSGGVSGAELEGDALESARWPCPMPKPGGIVGQILGIKKEADISKPVVSVEPVERRTAKSSGSGTA